MKVLWFTNTPANAIGYFGEKIASTGGWLQALNQELENKVQLSVAFYHNDVHTPFKYNNSTYYPIVNKQNKLYSRLLHKIINHEDLTLYLELINKINPDIVHIHGTENPFSCIIPYIKVPVVISIQGILTIYNYKFFSGFEKKYLNTSIINFLSIRRILFPKNFKYDFKMLHKMSRRELNNLKLTEYIIGRTDWDRRVSNVLAPNSNYFHNDEILRDSFYNSSWNYRHNDKLIIYSTNGNNFFKGFETICQSLTLLKNNGLNCEWRVGGINNNDVIVKIAKKKLRKNYPTESLKLLGNLCDSEIIENMMNAHLYVMASHIENSPNNLCEALILGVPCISTFVGGTSSLIENGKSGILIQDGDPWALAGAVIEMSNNYENAIEMGKIGRKESQIRHNKTKIVNELISIYSDIIHNHN